MSADGKKPARKSAIPFVSLFGGDQRNVLMALKDPKTPPELRAELQRYLDSPLKAATDDMQQLLDERAQYRGGRTSGGDREAAERVRDHIRALRVKYPTASAKALKLHADPLIVGELSDGRWANLVGEVAPRQTRKGHSS